MKVLTVIDNYKGTCIHQWIALLTVPRSFHTHTSVWWPNLYTHVEVKLNEVQYLVWGPNSKLLLFNVNPFFFFFFLNQAKALPEISRMMILATGEWKQHWQYLFLIISSWHRNKQSFSREKKKANSVLHPC